MTTKGRLLSNTAILLSVFRPKIAHFPSPSEFTGPFQLEFRNCVVWGKFEKSLTICVIVSTENRGIGRTDRNAITISRCARRGAIKSVVIGKDVTSNRKYRIIDYDLRWSETAMSGFTYLLEISIAPYGRNFRGAGHVWTTCPGSLLGIAAAGSRTGDMLIASPAP